MIICHNVNICYSMNKLPYKLYTRENGYPKQINIYLTVIN